MVDRNCPMDLLNTTFSNIKIDSLQNSANDILNKLQQSGLFRALVIETSGNKVLLDTAFGQLRGIATDQLAKGDDIIARLQPGKSDYTIKIEQIQTARQTLPDKIINQLSKIVSSTSVLPQAIKVLSHTNEKTLLQLGHKTYTIPRQPLLEAGETLLLKSSADNKVELLRIQPETILKNALSNLLPRVASTRKTTELAGLQKLISSFLKLKHADTTSFQTAAHNNKVNFQSASDANKEVPVKFIKQLLTTFSQPLARVDNFKAESLQQILRMFSLVKPAASANTAKALFSIPDNLGELHKAISSSPENFKSLLRQIIQSNAGEIKINTPESAMVEVSNTLKTELLQQLEQTLNQLLTQKTTIRLNQELNQPVQINLNIPLQVNDETTSLKLMIKQRNSNEQDEEKHWEINLSFEFALLGLISTNILLQDTKLSAHFWAVKSSTKKLIDTHMNQFKNQLKKSGFELGLVDCFMGKPALKDEAPHPVGENLVDINV